MLQLDGFHVLQLQNGIANIQFAQDTLFTVGEKSKYKQHTTRKVIPFRLLLFIISAAPFPHVDIRMMCEDGCVWKLYELEFAQNEREFWKV